MEIYTISGPEVQFMAPPTAQDTACAKQVAPLAIAGVAAHIGAVPVAAYGIYKGFKKNGAAAALSGVAALAIWFAGSRLISASLVSFQKCRGQ